MKKLSLLSLLSLLLLPLLLPLTFMVPVAYAQDLRGGTSGGGGGGISSVNGDATAAATVLTSYIDMKHKLVCDGSTDDTTAFNVSAATTGAVLMMPANVTCVLGNGILAAGVIIQGANTTLKAKSGMTGKMLYGNFTDGAGTRGNLIVDGNNETGLTYPVEFDNSNNISLEPGLIVKNSGATGGGAAAFQGGIKLLTSTGTVTGVHVTNVAGYCLELNTLSNVQVNGGEFDHCYKDGIVLATTGVGVSVNQANVHDVSDGGPSGNLGSYGNGIYCSGAVTCTISNSTITDIDYSGIRAANSSAVNVTGGTYTRTGDWAIYSEFASGPASITGAVVIDPLGGGINVANGADSNGNWNNTITGNTVRNAQGSSTNGTTTPVYGVCFLYTTRTIVNNNTCDGAYWGILGETTTATDSPTPGVQVSGNALVDTRPVTIVGTSPSGTISVGDQVYVGANWGAATKQGIVSVVADSTHITVKTLLGFFAAADALKDNTSGHTASTLTVSTVAGPTKQELTVSSVTNVKRGDTAALGSGSTASAGFVTCVPAASSPATNSPGCPTALHIIVSLRPNASGLNVLFPASGTLTTSSGGSVTISAATNTLINMQVPVVTNTDTTATCQQYFSNNLTGSYITGVIRSATGSPPSTTTAAVGSGICAVNIGGASLPITANGTTVANATTLNLQSGTYITQSVSNAAGVVTYQPDVDTAKVLTYASFQLMGSVPLTTTSSSSSVYTANASLSASTFVYANNQALVWNVGTTACAGGAMTLAINGLAAHAIVEADGSTTLASSECTANTPVSLVYDATGTVFRKVAGAGGGSSAFSSITAGTNTAALVVGTGGTLGFSGTGTINANRINGTAFSGTSGNLAGFGASNIPVDSLVRFATAGTNNTLTVTGGSSSDSVLLGTGTHISNLASSSTLALGGFFGTTVEVAGAGGLPVVTLGQSNTDLSSVFFGKITAPLISTSTNCANGASPAVCSAAPDGAIAIPTGVNPTLVINTSAVTASSRIFLTVDDSLTISGTTCNSTLATLVGGIAITGRSAGTSFTIAYNGTIATNPVCLSYKIEN